MLENSMTSSGVTAAIAVDDCWKRIGTRGDNSCVRLQEFFRCLNCPTFAANAAMLLDRPALQQDRSVADWHAEQLHYQQFDQEQQARTVHNASALIFRVGAEWLALPTTSIVEVIEPRVIHSLPHQANAAVLGLTNIRGALKICVALGRMLGSAGPGERNETGVPRALVVEHEQQILVFPVDDVAGVHTYDSATAGLPPATLLQAGGAYTQAIVNWRDNKVGLLDCGLLFYALNRSLT